MNGDELQRTHTTPDSAATEVKANDASKMVLVSLTDLMLWKGCYIDKYFP